MQIGDIRFAYNHGDRSMEFDGRYNSVGRSQFRARITDVEKENIIDDSFTKHMPIEVETTFALQQAMTKYQGLGEMKI